LQKTQDHAVSFNSTLYYYTATETSCVGVLGDGLYVFVRVYIHIDVDEIVAPKDTVVGVGD